MVEELIQTLVEGILLSSTNIKRRIISKIYNINNNRNMKKVLSILILLVGLTVSVSAKDYVAPTRKSVEYTDSTTTDTYTINNKKYNVCKSKSGAFYIWKTSKKTNKKYKYYLPKEIQKQMGREYNI